MMCNWYVLCKSTKAAGPSFQIIRTELTKILVISVSRSSNVAFSFSLFDSQDDWLFGNGIIIYSWCENYSSRRESSEGRRLDYLMVQLPLCSLRRPSFGPGISIIATSCIWGQSRTGRLFDDEFSHPISILFGNLISRYTLVVFTVIVFSSDEWWADTNGSLLFASIINMPKFVSAS